MRPFRDIPIRRKLAVVIILPCAVVVIMGGAASLSYELVRYRRGLARDLTTQAEIIGNASAAALAFHDADAARDTLSALHARSDILFACLYTPGGKVFEKFDPSDAVIPPPQRAGYRFDGGHLLVFRQIKLGNDTVGSICLGADMREERTRLISYSAMAVVVMLVSLSAALTLSRRLQRVVTEPILALTNVMRAVGERRDYSVRVAKESEDEIGVLTDGFNQMLAQIQSGEESLHASEERFRQVTENIREVFWMTNLDKSEMIYISPAYEEVWGRAVGALYAEPRSWLEGIHPDDRERVHAELPKQAKGRYDEQYRVVRPDGSTRWIRDRAFPVRDSEGNVYRVAGIAEDITERKRAVQALHESEQRLKAILDNSTAVVYLKDTQGRYVLINRRFEELFHVTTEQIAGKTDYDLFPKDKADAFRANDRQVLGAVKPQEFEEVAPQEDGLHTYISIKFPLFDAAGAPYAVCGISTDITERKRLVEQLIQAEKMDTVGRLAAGIAHEVKNPLMALMMGVDYLAQVHGADDETRSTLDDMREAIEHANVVITGLLDYSAPMALNLKLQCVNEILDRALRLLRHELTKHHIHSTCQLAPDLPSLPLDGNKLEQVFLNLFMNAAQAMAGGGTLAVRTFANPPGGVTVEIDDTGPGIPENQLSKVFDPFFTTKAPGKGTGLGLTVVKQIIALHGGSIEVCNRADGGLRVTIKLNPHGANKHEQETNPDH
jgi:PAS domain S-box-containing protein